MVGLWDLRYNEEIIKHLTKIINLKTLSFIINIKIHIGTFHLNNFWIDSK